MSSVAVFVYLCVGGHIRGVCFVVTCFSSLLLFLLWCLGKVVLNDFGFPGYLFFFKRTAKNTKYIVIKNAITVCMGAAILNF